MKMMWKMLRDTWRLSAPGENLVACLFVVIPLVAILYCLIAKKKKCTKAGCYCLWNWNNFVDTGVDF